MDQPVYVAISNSEGLPDITQFAPFRAVVVIELDLDSQQMGRLADWLVESGCLYMMAWGRGCSDFHDAVDWANIRAFEPGDIPDDSFVMTTWHDNEPLEEVFWFAGFCALHGDVELRSTLIVHAGQLEAETELLQRYAQAQLSE